MITTPAHRGLSSIESEVQPQVLSLGKTLPGSTKVARHWITETRVHFLPALHPPFTNHDSLHHSDPTMDLGGHSAIIPLRIKKQSVFPLRWDSGPWRVVANFELRASRLSRTASRIHQLKFELKATLARDLPLSINSRNMRKHEHQQNYTSLQLCQILHRYVIFCHL